MKKVELDKQDLVNLVNGITPDYSAFNIALVKNNGTYRGGFHDEWVWNTTSLRGDFHDEWVWNPTSLESLSETQLWDLYIICKKSWE